eukprot:UN04585
MNMGIQKARNNLTLTEMKTAACVSNTYCVEMKSDAVYEHEYPSNVMYDDDDIIDIINCDSGGAKLQIIQIFAFTFTLVLTVAVILS